MIAPHPFNQYYAPLWKNAYDVVDRIVLKAYFGLGSSPGGFRLWWHRLHGTDDKDRFARTPTVRRATKRPRIDCGPGMPHRPARQSDPAPVAPRRAPQNRPQAGGDHRTRLGL